jgi:hypothetical protein
LLIYFDYDDPNSNTTFDIQKYLDLYKNNFNDFLLKFKKACTKYLKFDYKDNYQFLYNEKNFSKYLEKDEEQDKYEESIYLCNPCIITSNNAIAEAMDLSINDKTKVLIHDNIRPEKTVSDKSVYNRGIAVTYFNKSENFDEIDRHFTSMFILFHRTKMYYEKYCESDEQLDFLYKISDTLNNKWEKGRAYLLSLSGMGYKNKFDSTYYNLMELNTMMDGEITRLNSTIHKINKRYKHQYGRVLANFNTSDANLIEKHEKVLYLLLTPIRNREDLIDEIKNLKEPTNIQLERLRDLFDARSSSYLNGKMLILTVFVTIWGIYTFWYSGMFNGIGMDQSFIAGMDMLPTLLLVSTIVATIISMVFIMNNLAISNGAGSSKLLRKVKKVIKNKKSKDKIDFDTLFNLFKREYSKYIMNSVPEEQKIGTYSHLLVILLIIKVYSSDFSISKFLDYIK